MGACTRLRRRGLLLFVFCLAATAVSPVLASADTFCVDSAGCAAGHVFDNDLQGALDAATANGSGVDVIQVGAVTLAAGPYSNGSPVELKGAGIGQTVLSKPSGTEANVLRLSGPASKVSDLTLIPTAAPGLVVPSGVQLENGAQAQRVEVSLGAFLNTGASGASLFGGSILSESILAVPMSGGNVAVTLHGNSTVERSTLSGDIGIESANDGSAATNLGRALRISARQGGVEAFGSTLDLQSSLLQTQGANSVGLLANGNSCCNSAAIDAENVTEIGDGSPGSVGLEVLGEAATAPSSATGTGIFDSSLMRGYATPFSRHGEAAGGGQNPGTASLAVRYSSYDQTAPVSAGGPGPEIKESNLGAIDPGFVSAGDYHLTSASPLIDRGDPAAVTGTDLDGLPRVVDGDGNGSAIRDIGAYEFQYSAPPSSPPAASQAPSPSAMLPPPPSPRRMCVVPKLKGAKLKASKKKSRVVDCKLGKVTKRKGAKAKTGRIVKQKPAPGTVLAPGSKVSVTLAG